jgi:hypothetical protein
MTGVEWKATELEKSFTALSWRHSGESRNPSRRQRVIGKMDMVKDPWKELNPAQ